MRTYRTKKYKARIDNGAKRILTYILITTAILLVLTFWGLTLLASLSNFWDSLRGSNLPSPTQDKTPPSPPFLSSLAEYTNKNKVTISGYTEGGATVTLFKDGEELDKQLVGTDGQFSFKDVPLKSGLNTFTAKAADLTNNESGESRAIQITLDTTAPKVNITEPVDGATSTEQYVNVKGTTDQKATVTVNDQQFVVQSDGSFSGVTYLSPGANSINFVVTDEAGNQTKITRTVTYAP